MKKVDYIEGVAEKTGLTKADSAKAFDAVFDVIKEALKKEGKAAIAGFGTFNVSKRAAREGRNPRTGETVKIPARNTVGFKAGSALKETVN